jgi:membrane protein implicated in regulation of membrane protease activity
VNRQSLHPIYAIRESPYRWLILAGIALLLGMFGAMFMLAYVWPHWLARLWLWASLIATAGLLIVAAVDWKRRVEQEREMEERKSARSAELRKGAS